MDRLESMYNAQRDLQQKSYGYDFANMPTQDRVAFIKNMVLALTDELHEALAETSWKPWASGQFINENEYKRELVDAFHFFMNLMIAAEMTTDELYEGYIKKRQVNENRQAAGYDGVSTKMPCCGRAAEDVGFTQIHKSDGTIDFVKCVCGQNVDGEFIRRVLVDL